MAVMITGWVVLLLGVLLGAGGIWLAALGDTWAYIVLGVGWAVSGALLVARRRAALWAYAVLLAFATVWALHEVGLDRWGLAPRLPLFWLIGLWLMTSWVARGLRQTKVASGTSPAFGATRILPSGPPVGDEVAQSRRGWYSARAALGTACVLVFFVGLASLAGDPFDLAGELPTPSKASEAAHAANGQAASADWRFYGGSERGERYSALADITPQNIGTLKLAWTYHTGDPERPGDPIETTAENTPLKVGALLYLCTKHDHVVALDAASGQRRWEFDPKIHPSHAFQHLNCRGLAYHDATAATAASTSPASSRAAALAFGQATSAAVGANAVATETCDRRVILPSIDARLFELDADTGKPCVGFGREGVVDLAVDMDNLENGNYMETSPPVVTSHLIVVGSSINDNESVDNPSGVIRAFDVNDGHLVWSWDMGKPDPTRPLAPGEKYTPNTPSAWAPPSVDEALGLAYFPLGNLSPDQLGAKRSAATERFASSVIALDLSTGKLRWSFQGVHHDLWDRDMPAQPTLVDLDIDGARVPALVQPTKQGDVFVLDRRDGKPILPVTEMPAPPSTLASEHASPTQPRSNLSFMPPPLKGSDMWGATPFDQLACRIAFRRAGYQGPYTPPATTKTITYPSNLGGFDWGGVAVDPNRQALVGVPVHMAYTYKLVARPGPEANVVTAGKPEHINENKGAPYAIKAEPFLSALGLPCQAPPWGAVASADLRTGRVVWMHRNGTTRDRMPSFWPIPFRMGMPGFGSPLVTAGGVFFYSGALDNVIRGYDETTGRVLWQARLPAGGQATPMTYRANGKQYVVVSAGGHGAAGTTLGDSFLAYALP
jgi:quinoprotein glucose dehydrogenase